MTVTADVMFVPGPTAPERARQFSAAEIAAAFAEDDPDPTPEQRAELERLILAELRTYPDGEVVAWRKLRRAIPAELREFDSTVLTSMWSDGKVWLCSVGGRWVVSLGDDFDAARAERDRAEHRTTAPQAV